MLDLDLLTATRDARLSGLSGEGALLAGLRAGRTGRMGDIVATIQGEQDAIIRSELGGALVVQGGPGTGKTAVALHRAAYLLYAHRRMLERSGVLLVGPSRTFLRYIDQVLPSLGETGVVTTTVAELYPGIAATATEDEAVAELKGRALWARRHRPRRARPRARSRRSRCTCASTGTTWSSGPNDIASAIARARRNHQPHNQARVTFVRDMLGRLADQYVDAAGLGRARRRARRDHRGAAHHPRDPDRAQPRVDADHAAEAASPTCGRKPRAARVRRPGARRRSSARCCVRDADAPWTPADVPLLDEAAELLGEDDQAARAEARAAAERRASEVAYARQVLESTGSGGMVSAEMLADRFATTGPTLTTAERAAADRSWTYGHVVVDEAQELSAMAWRSLLRRVPTRSLTIVGDVAQTTAAAGARSWAAPAGPRAALVVAAQRADRELPDARRGRRHRPARRRRRRPARQPADVGARGATTPCVVERARPTASSAAVAERAEKLVAEVTRRPRAPGASRSSRSTPRLDGDRATPCAPPGCGPRVGTGSSAADLDAPLVVLTPARGQGARVRRRRARRAGRGARRERRRPVRRDDPSDARAARAPRPPAAPRLAEEPMRRLTPVRGPDRVWARPAAGAP